MHTNIIAILLAAGRGSRMKGFTDDRPKCLLELCNKRLLDWQIESIRKAKIENILVVRGYLAEKIEGDFQTIENTCWSETNMVSSLLCAFEKLENTTALISYSDIVYRHEHLEKLREAKGDIVITYDKNWEELWQLRNENPLDDAETFKEKNGILLEIGQKAKSIEEIQGQYMGLLKFSPKGQEIVKAYVKELENIDKTKVDKLDMTSLLNALLKNNVTINTVAIEGRWVECDTQSDIAIYEERLKENRPWTHDWR